MSGNDDWDHIVYPGEEGGYQVEAGQKGKAYDGVLRTGGLDKCIAIAAVNHSEDIGYMKHIAGYQAEPEEFARDLEDLMLDIDNESGDDDQIEYILAGSNFDDQDVELSDGERNQQLHDIQNIAGQRMIAEELVSTKTDNFHTEWGSEEGYTSELFLDMNDPSSFIYDRQSDIHDDGDNL